MAKRLAGIEPWGEGFAQDSWSTLAAVDQWDHVTPDEYIRFFPRLAGRPEVRLPDVVREHLTEAVAVRVWRRGLEGRGLALAGLDAAALADLGSRAADRWFARPSLIGRATGWLIGRRLASRAWAGDDAGALHHLAGLVAIVNQGRTPAYTESAAMAVAFHGGLHPAYLWSEVLSWAESATAAGWLGVLARGRAALMPEEAVAPLIDAVVLAPDGTGRLRDARFAACGFSGTQWAALAQAARGVTEGRGTIVRLVPAGRPAPAKAGTNDPALPAAAMISR